MSTQLIWFRRDLRLSDQAAVTAAARDGAPVLGVFLLPDPMPYGGASRWWLHHALSALAAALEARGGRLILRRGTPLAALSTLVAETGATALHATRESGDAALQAALKQKGIRLFLHDGLLLHDPDTVRTRSGTPYSVFTPFWKTLCQSLSPPPSLPAPARLVAPPVLPASEALDAWGLLPTRPDWAAGLRQTWVPGEAGAQARLAAFLDHGLDAYDLERDRPDRPGTSRLAPHLAWGEVSPRQVWNACRLRSPSPGNDAFIRQIGWREFSAHLLHHHPEMPVRPLKAAFERFPWATDVDPLLQRWRKGQTGYPIVDAGMRQLWTTGWMHNRVRMIVASFLVKDLLVPWGEGLQWFHDTLVDADPANNAAGWQWVAGCGADAAPYFRIFNPVTQAIKVDPKGEYVRRWVPELARLPAPLCHQPWLAKPLDLQAAGVRLGVSYPLPIVDHARARDQALAALRQLGEGVAPPEPSPPGAGRPLDLLTFSSSIRYRIDLGAERSGGEGWSACVGGGKALALGPRACIVRASSTLAGFHPGTRLCSFVLVSGPPSGRIR